MAIRVFPVQGGAGIPNDFSLVSTATLRKHLGNDLMAPVGTPLLAVDDGTVRFGTDPLGGNVANLYAQDGTRYYYAHLSAFRGASRAVHAGEVIGYLGTTGNAEGGAPHTHFEVHPQNGPAVNPFGELNAALLMRPAKAGFPWLSLLGISAILSGGWYLLTRSGR